MSVFRDRYVGVTDHRARLSYPNDARWISINRNIKGISMRIIALFLFPTLALAAPAPKQPQKPAVEVTLSADSPLELKIVIENKGKEPLELPFRVTPFEHFVVILEGEKGKQFKIEQSSTNAINAKPGTLTIPPGKSKTLSLHTCHYLPEVGEADEKFTFIAQFKFAGKTIESKPLTVGQK